MSGNRERRSRGHVLELADVNVALLEAGLQGVDPLVRRPSRGSGGLLSCCQSLHGHLERLLQLLHLHAQHTAFVNTKKNLSIRFTNLGFIVT